MVSQITLAILGLASTAVATYSPLQLRNLHNLRQEHVVVEVRQVSSAEPEIPTITQSPECFSALAPLGSDLPSVPLELLSYMESFAATADVSNPTILCEATQVPQSLSSLYSSYDQAASSWLSKHSSDLQVAVTKCGGSDAQVSEAVASISAFIGDGCGASSSGASSSAASAGSAGSTTASQGLAARPTGMVAGAMAAAGALGVAVLL